MWKPLHLLVFPTHIQVLFHFVTHLYVYDNDQEGSVKPCFQGFTLYNCHYGITGLCQMCSGFKDPIFVLVLTNTFYNHQHGIMAPIRMVVTPLTSHDLCTVHIAQLSDVSNYSYVT